MQSGVNGSFSTSNLQLEILSKAFGSFDSWKISQLLSRSFIIRFRFIMRLSRKELLTALKINKMIIRNQRKMSSRVIGM
jgi:hypothetical protein